MKFLQKLFLFDFIEFTVGYFNGYERFCNFKQAKWKYKSFISTFFNLLKFISYTEMKCDGKSASISFSFIRGISSSKFDDILFERWRSALTVFRLLTVFHCISEVHGESCFVFFRQTFNLQAPLMVMSLVFKTC